ncbi:MAG: transcription antitermination factor NusB [Candidatus Margulisiibacteriota bacterium]
MGKRNTGRKLAMQALYQADIRQVDMADVTPLFLDESGYMEETKTWALELAHSAWAYRHQADTLIQQFSIGWSLDRLNPIDKAILRLAFYEMIEVKTDPRIVIDEALEIAKKYSEDDSARFINGILGQYIKDGTTA